MIDDSTLGGYFEKHARPPAFEGKDGRAYSVSIITSDEKEARGVGAALFFVLWSDAGDAPVGHLETDYLEYGDTFASAKNTLERITLMQVKEHLDNLIDRRTEDSA